MPALSNEVRRRSRLAGTRTARRGIAAAVAATLAALPVAELVAFRRWGSFPVPGPYGLDGTVGGRHGTRWVWLGDSLSSGVGADYADDSFPRLTAGIVAGLGRCAVDLRCLAVPGATSMDVLLGQLPIAVSLLDHEAVAVVAVGCNDVLRLVRVTSFRRTYSLVIGRLAATGATVVAVGVPDLASMMTTMAQPLRALMAWSAKRIDLTIKQVAADHAVAYVAIADAPAFTYATLSDDGWHPNGAGYRTWAALVAPHLLRVGKARPSDVAPERS